MIVELEHLLDETKSNQEKQILRTLIENFDNITNMTLEQIADLSYCSKTSVRRLIMKLGYKGFIDFQFNIKLESKDSNIDNEKDTKNLNTFENMINFINNSDKIYIYGRGINNLAAEYLFRILIEKGYTAICITSRDLLYELEKENIVIISTFGQSEKTIETLKHLMEKAKSNIAIITSSNSTVLTLVEASLLYDCSKLINKNDQVGLFKVINELSKHL